MKRSLFTAIAALAIAVSGFAVQANEGAVHLEHSGIQPDNKVSLQNGARLFVNYCLGCHSLEHQRYERMATDLDLSKDVVVQNLMFTGEKIGDQMKIAMRKEDAAKWFGAPPPDLTLEARMRGTDWIYTYLKSFYQDEKRPYGVNNAVFPNVGMPHALQNLQGMQVMTGENKETGVASFELITDGSMTPAEYEQSVRDITNFLAYVSEPIQHDRRVYGVYVMLFLLAFLALGYRLKKEYWKDIYPHGH